MIKLYEGGVYLVNGETILPEGNEANLSYQQMVGEELPRPDKAAKGTITYQILEDHNHAEGMDKLKIKFDKLASHDITYVGIIQTVRACGLERFPIPYVLTNCHNSLCAVGGTINEDDHIFGLTAAKRYGGAYVPPHQAVIHQYAREVMSKSGSMILGSDSHTRYGALGTMAMGEGGPELVKQLLGQTYDIDYPKVVAVYLKNEPILGVGPQDVALAIIGAVFKNGYVNNKVMEFVGPGVNAISPEYRIGIDVMTTETTCLSSIWKTDEKVKAYYEIHKRPEDYKELNPEKLAYYDGLIEVDLSQIRPMIAMPFHPSNVYKIEDLNANLEDILRECEIKANESLAGKGQITLLDKIRDGRFYVEQGIIAGCSGGTYENIVDAMDILGDGNIGNDIFTLSVYPSSTPIYMELAKNGYLARLMGAGAVVKTAFCGPCFGAGDTPANNTFSIRHTTRNFPSREGSRPQDGQATGIALMDARSIAATARNKGYLTPATDFDFSYQRPTYHFDSSIYEARVFDSKNIPDYDVEVILGPNIKDWPKMSALPEHLILKVVSEIHDEVTTTDELIPSGETSSYRSNPLKLAEFALSRRDPEYVAKAKAVQEAQKLLEVGQDPVKGFEEIAPILDSIIKAFPQINMNNIGIGSTIFAVKPGDGSAREQAASCQKVLGGWANIANEYATKRYRSNLMNWGMVPFTIERGELPFTNGDYILVPNIRQKMEEKVSTLKAYVVTDEMRSFNLGLGEMTDDERQIILDGCLINYNRNQLKSR